MIEVKVWLKELLTTLRTAPAILVAYTKWLMARCTQVLGTLKTASRSFISKISQIVRRKKPEVKSNAGEEVQRKAEEAS